MLDTLPPPSDLDTSPHHDVPEFADPVPLLLEKMIVEIRAERASHAVAMQSLTDLAHQLMTNNTANSDMVLGSINALRDEMRPRLANLESEARLDRSKLRELRGDFTGLRTQVSKMERDLAQIKAVLSLEDM